MQQLREEFPDDGYHTYLNNRYFIPHNNKNIIYDIQERRILKKSNSLKDMIIIFKIRWLRFTSILYLRTPLGYLKYYDHFKVLRQRDPNKPLIDYFKINWRDLYEGLKWV